MVNVVEDYLARDRAHKEGQRNLERRRAQETQSPNEPGADGWPKGRTRPKLRPIECPECGGDAAETEKGNVVCSSCAQAAEWGRFHDKMRQERLEKAGLLKEPLSKYTLDSFEADTAALRRARRVVVDWLMGFPYSHGESVLLWSDGYGVGKTHLAHAVHRELLITGSSVTFFFVADMLSSIRDSYNRDSEETEKGIVSRARSGNVLVLDDLAKEHVTERGRPWFHDLMLRIVDYRYNTGRSMLITSNASPDRFGEIVGGAAASRLYRMLGGRIVDMSGPDWRMK